MRPDFDSPGTFGHLVFLGMEAAAMDKAAMTTPTRAARRHQLSELRSEVASTSRTTSTAQATEKHLRRDEDRYELHCLELSPSEG